MKKERTHIRDVTYHLIWVTKYRKEVFNTSEKKNAMRHIIIDICSKQEIELSEIEVADDHIHLVCSFPTKYSISYIMKVLKGVSARKYFEKYPDTKNILWSGELYLGSYFVSTVGNVSKEIVLKYVKEQLTQYNGGRPRRNSARG